jgi:hypothetical protein
MHVTSRRHRSFHRRHAAFHGCRIEPLEGATLMSGDWATVSYGSQYIFGA